jgi:hypothetical protein
MKKEALEFDIDYVTLRMERFDELVKKYSPEEFEVLDDGNERIERVKDFISRLPTLLEPKIEFEYFPTRLTVGFCVTMSDMLLPREMMKELAELSDIIDSFYILPLDDLMSLSIDVRYFKGEKTPEELAEEEIKKILLTPEFVCGSIEEIPQA